MRSFICWYWTKNNRKKCSTDNAMTSSNQFALESCRSTENSSLDTWQNKKKKKTEKKIERNKTKQNKSWRVTNWLVWLNDYAIVGMIVLLRLTNKTALIIFGRIARLCDSVIMNVFCVLGCFFFFFLCIVSFAV